MGTGLENIALGLGASDPLGNYMKGKKEQELHSRNLASFDFNMEQAKSNAADQKALKSATAQTTAALSAQRNPALAAAIPPEQSIASSDPKAVVVPEAKSLGGESNGGVPPGDGTDYDSATGMTAADRVTQQMKKEGTFVPLVTTDPGLRPAQGEDEGGGGLGGRASARPAAGGRLGPAPKVAPGQVPKTAPTGSGKQVATADISAGAAKAAGSPSVDDTVRNSHLVLTAAQSNYKTIELYQQKQIEAISKKYPQGSDEWVREVNALALSTADIRKDAENKLLQADAGYRSAATVQKVREIATFIHTNNLDPTNPQLLQNIKNSGMDPVSQSQLLRTIQGIEVAKTATGGKMYRIKDTGEWLNSSIITDLVTGDFASAQTAINKLNEKVMEGQKARMQVDSQEYRAKIQADARVAAAKKSGSGGADLDALLKQNQENDKKIALGRAYLEDTVEVDGKKMLGMRKEQEGAYQVYKAFLDNGQADTPKGREAKEKAEKLWDELEDARVASQQLDARRDLKERFETRLMGDKGYKAKMVLDFQKKKTELSQKIRLLKDKIQADAKGDRRGKLSQKQLAEINEEIKDLRKEISAYDEKAKRLSEMPEPAQINVTNLGGDEDRDSPNVD